MWLWKFNWICAFCQQEMETIKETDDEESELHEDQTLIKNKTVKALEDFEKQSSVNLPNLTRKSTFPRNFSTMSFVSKQRRRDSKESIMSSYSRLDFTGSSLQLQLQVIFVFIICINNIFKCGLLGWCGEKTVNIFASWRWWLTYAQKHELSWSSIKFTE